MLEEKMKFGTERAQKAYALLSKYKSGKINLERRIVDNDRWWRMRKSGGGGTSAWLFNSVANKHADIMDNFPEPVVLPREESDTSAASVLSGILPVILEQNRFEEIYSDTSYDKLKGGTGIYGVFWNKSKEGGIGDIDIRRTDILNLFWEPGVCDIESSPALFCVSLCDNSVLAQKYPALKGTFGMSAPEVMKYEYDDTVSVTDKSAVVDMYYKTRENGREVLQLSKLCNGAVLYSSEDDPGCEGRGFYEHGKYPFVFDRLYTEQGTPAGYGCIDVMKGCQSDIDALGELIVKNAKLASARRFFIRGDGIVNEEEYGDFTKPFIHYTGSGSPSDNVSPIEVPPLPEIYLNVLNGKINELKETSGNRDFTQGGTVSGVTAAAAISALQETGNKLSRDIMRGSYRAFEKVCFLIIELIRQFYDFPRCFRISGRDGKNVYPQFDNSLLGKKISDTGFFERRPVFDIKISARKLSPMARTSRNELAEKLFSLGMFEPGKESEALACLEIMDFDGREEVIEYVKNARSKRNNTDV